MGTVKPLYSSHHWDRVKVSAIRRCLLHRDSDFLPQSWFLVTEVCLCISCLQDFKEDKSFEARLETQITVCVL